MKYSSLWIAALNLLQIQAQEGLWSHCGACGRPGLQLFIFPCCTF